MSPLLRLFTRALPAALGMGLACAPAANAQGPIPPGKVQDLSLLVARDMPCVWPLGMTPFAVVPTATFPRAGRHRDMLIIDEHTGTQWDAPAHFVPPPDSGLPGAGPNGLITGEKVPAWQFCGEACVIDVTALRDQAENGKGRLIGPDIVQAWEKQHRPLGPGDVVLFRSDYTDSYYKPFPAGDRFVAKALRKETPGWPAPNPETMEYLAGRGVMTLGLDGASMGALPDMAVPTHQAGGKRGMIWVECATNLKSLPATGSFFAILAAKHAGGSGGECRCVAITDPAIASELISRAKGKRVADLSVTLHEDYPIVWPGRGPGEEGGRYVSKVLNAFSPQRGPYFALTHLFDSHAGTHVNLPSFSLPADTGESAKADPAVQARLRAFEAKFGKLPTVTATTESMPLHQTMGNLHLVDVRPLAGKTAFSEAKPSGPIITVDFLKEHAKAKPFQPGEIVTFRTGHTDSKLKPLPAAPDKDALFVLPLEGKAEGWATPSPEALAWLAGQGIRCVATDGPTLGGVDPDLSQQVDWQAAAKGLLVVEFLTNLQAVEGKEAYLLFAPIKIEGTRGGYGRALAILK